MRLLKKGQTGLRTVLFSRLGLITLLLALQLVLLLGVLYKLSALAPYYAGAAALLVTVMGLWLVNSPLEPAGKLTWMTIIAVMPVFGALLYLYTELDIGHRALGRRVQQLQQQTAQLLPQSEAVRSQLLQTQPRAAAMTEYVARSGCYPVYRGTEVEYYAEGEQMFAALLREIEKAEKFIFLEYFIVAEGEMWGSILQLLAQKAAAGVDVRVLYDSSCEFFTLPHNYPARLAALGIKAKMFAPARPFVSTHYNYRDHRKITVIDGHTAFTGGVNLADEYINRVQKYGRWKDTAVMLKGEAARSFTLMFLQMWNLDERQGTFAPFLSPPQTVQQGEGFVMPFGDCPLDSYKTAQQVYIDLLYRAERYVHIMTPYLIIDSDMEAALKYAAGRGVDVKLMLPAISDSRAAHALARGHYPALLQAGVEIYEYTPGYVHAKQFIADGREAVIGTVNLDYRSLWHHYECAVWLCGVPCIADMERDFQQTLTLCAQMTPQTVAAGRRSTRLLGKVLKVFAPLL
ncbi:MAG: PLDc N-terminal domain-containing protein [Oscillospiraceae bacterium]|nr:PLDc N-terminal domain-containing protein [Oscillospiraceae bacterium]